jgi:flavin reductase (DIM6/NTAB) family NADH-FMN oxidoreductase RutF
MSVVEGLPRNLPGQAGLAGQAAAAGDGLRSVFGKFATGVTVVASGGEVPRGMTANSFTSVSIRPPLILVCVNRQSSLQQAVLDCGSFAVSILSARQEHVARYFADRSRPRGLAEFDAVDWTPAPRTGAPVVDGALAWLDCALAASYDGGDHTIFIGSVLASGWEPEHDALLFFSSGFHRPQLAQPALRETA